MTDPASGRGEARARAARAPLRLKLLVAAIVPAAVFALAELALWAAGVRPLGAEDDPLAGFARGLRLFEPVPGRGVLAIAERATRRSFAPQELRLEKPAGGFRVFTLGGSSAQGFPWGPERAFTRLLGDALQASYPARVVEAVNASGMSYASHRLRIVADEIAALGPDVVIFYEGHNEFVERRFYGAVRARADALGAWGRALQGWRLYAAVARLLGRDGRAPRAGAADGAAGRSGAGALVGLDVVREKGTVTGEDERQEVARRFEENVRAVIAAARRAGARVVLCTVPANLRDWAPNEAVLDGPLDDAARARFVADKRAGEAALAAGDPARAVKLLEQARAIAPGHALVHFRLGKAYEALGRFEDARRAYVAARDLDAQPGRATSALNGILRRLAASETVALLDAERLFEEASPQGLVGFNLIEDYVHPTPEGHRLIARALHDLALRSGWLGPPRPPDEEAFRRATERPADGADRTRTAAMLYNTGVVLAAQGHVERALETYRACLEQNPFYSAARLNLGLLLYAQGKHADALEAFRTVLEYQPDDQQARVAQGWALLALGRHAVEVFRYATARDGRDASAWYGLGVALRRQTTRAAEAEAALRRTVELEPGHADGRCALGELVLALGRAVEAVEHFRGCARLRPESGAASAWLGWALQRQGKRDEAVAAYRAALALDPGNPWARAGLTQLTGGAPAAAATVPAAPPPLDHDPPPGPAAPPAGR